jgi:hypothetical protein
VELISIPICLHEIVKFIQLYVYQSGVKNHPSDVQGLICQIHSDIGPDHDFPNGALCVTRSEKIRYGEARLCVSLESASSITINFACHKLKMQYCYFLIN